MNWSEILLLVSAALSLFLLFYKGSGHRQIRIFAAIAILSVSVTLFPGMFSAREAMVLEWARITGITTVLLVLAFIIRQLKPYYARYPYPFSFTPLAVLIFYPMVSDTAVLKDLLNQILQGGALLIALLLTLSLGRRIQKRFILWGGVLLLTISCAAYWMISAEAFSPWLWQSSLALGMVLCSWSFMDISELLDQGN